jgi:hypothetical protein
VILFLPFVFLRKQSDSMTLYGWLHRFGKDNAESVLPWLSPGSYPIFARILEYIQPAIGFSESTKNDILYHMNLMNYQRGLFFICSVLVVAYIGYYMSRVWFSWYLAVSLAFDGHNNEAGGAARLEGFKHILRIRVKKEELTVYVIGFEEAKTDIDKLELTLVDKFTLYCNASEAAEKQARQNAEA